MKKTILGLMAIVAMGASTAFAAPETHTNAKIHGEYGNSCAMGLTKGLKVTTNCEINWTDPSTKKTYCFSSEAMKTEWSKNTTANLAKASAEYTKLSAGHAAQATTNKKS